MKNSIHEEPSMEKQLEGALMLAKINKLLSISGEVNINDPKCYEHNSFTERMKEQNQLMNEIKVLAKKYNTIWGRILKFPMADSYALYIIIGMNKKTVTVHWLNYCDGWKDNRLGVYGKLDMAYAMSTIHGEDRLEELFSKK